MTDMEILVGTDGSRGGDQAVRWAAREAQLSGAALKIMTTFDWNWTSGRVIGGVSERDLAENAAETVLADSRLLARHAAPDLGTILCEAAGGGAAAALIRAAREAALLVVGSRGRGGFANLLLGSVGQRVSVHAPCPVAVVRGRTDRRTGPVVVGTDGGETSVDALATAFGMAAERGAPVVALRAYGAPGVPADEEAALQEELLPWRDKFPEVRAAARVVARDATAALIDMSRTAQLLVVGASGHAAFAGTLLGSVALRTLHQSACPVVVAREPWRPPLPVHQACPTGPSRPVRPVPGDRL